MHHLAVAGNVVAVPVFLCGNGLENVGAYAGKVLTGESNPFTDAGHSIAKGVEEDVLTPLSNGKGFEAGQHVGRAALETALIVDAGVGLIGKAGEVVNAARAARAAAESGILGKIELPANWKFGTTISGQDAHVATEQILRQRLVAQGVDDGDIISRVLPGERGIDMSVAPKYIDKLGFEHIEIKPNTLSGESTYNGQIRDWGYDPATVRVVTYDTQGNLRWGFKYK